MSEAVTVEEKTEPSVQPAAGKSVGARWFDRGVYGGLAGVGTFVLTVPVTYLFKHHARVAPYFERAVDGLHRGLMKISPAMKRETADKILTTTALMQGGNMMLLPIGVLEKHKVAIVSGLNTMAGDATPPEQIELAPKQTWLSLVQSRVVAWLAVFAAFKGAEKFVPKSLTMFENEVGERMCQLFKKPIERLVDGKMVKSKTYIYGKIGALDIFATIAAATLLYVGGHFFARRHEEKQERKAMQHGGHAPLKDEADVVQVDAAAPAAKVEGERSHEGVVAGKEREQAANDSRYVVRA